MLAVLAGELIGLSWIVISRGVAMELRGGGPQSESIENSFWKHRIR